MRLSASVYVTETRGTRKPLIGETMKNIYLRFICSASALGAAAVMLIGAAPLTSAHRATASDACIVPSATNFAVTDPQIAAIVVAANSVDIEAGKLAQSKTRNKKVREFADSMVRDHTAVNKAAVDLVTRLGVTPEENDTSRSLTTSGEQTRARLNGLSGKAFDRAYIDNEVAYHKLVIEALDKTLIPSAQNAELKQTLISVRPSFIAHLQHAEQLQASLGGKKSVKGSSRR
jgi:putative membrane protein